MNRKDGFPAVQSTFGGWKAAIPISLSDSVLVEQDDSDRAIRP